MLRVIFAYLVLAGISCAASGAEYPFRFLLGNSYKPDPRLSAEDAWKARWKKYDYVFIFHNDGTRIDVNSCEELEKSFKNNEHPYDTAGMGAEKTARAICTNVSWLRSVPSAKNSSITLPLCINKSLYMKIAGAINLSANKGQLWGTAGLETVETTKCDLSGSSAVVKYNRVIDEGYEGSDPESAARSGEINIELLAQGDFDGDGWLDIVAFVSTHPIFGEGNGYRSDNMYHTLMKISAVNGVLSVSPFHDAFDDL